jgi:hypothetical protein
MKSKYRHVKLQRTADIQGFLYIRGFPIGTPSGSHRVDQGETRESLVVVLVGREIKMIPNNLKDIRNCILKEVVHNTTLFQVPIGPCFS